MPAVHVHGKGYAHVTCCTRLTYASNKHFEEQDPEAPPIHCLLVADALDDLRGCRNTQMHTSPGSHKAMGKGVERGRMARTQVFWRAAESRCCHVLCMVSACEVNKNLSSSLVRIANCAAHRVHVFFGQSEVGQANMP